MSNTNLILKVVCRDAPMVSENPLWVIEVNYLTSPNRRSFLKNRRYIWLPMNRLLKPNALPGFYSLHMLWGALARVIHKTESTVGWNSLIIIIIIISCSPFQRVLLGLQEIGGNVQSGLALMIRRRIKNLLILAFELRPRASNDKGGGPSIYRTVENWCSLQLPYGGVADALAPCRASLGE